MIPKKIHYCWFGGKPLPQIALKCINSWRKYLPDYEIIEWNETNFDVKQNLYISEAYSEKKFAFVSDFARFKILHEHGGIYFDTDVEIIKSFDDILRRGSFLGCEGRVDFKNSSNSPLSLNVNPGLGMGAPKGLEFYEEMINFYSNKSFLDDKGQIDGTVVSYTTKMLMKYGLKFTSEIQKIKDIYIYPWTYFCPFNDITGKIEKTKNTHSIHWYQKSWFPHSKLRTRISRLSHRIFGIEISQKFKIFFK